jgi:release factor glutamine methyltransferase
MNETIASLLAATQLPPLEMRILLAHTLRRSRAWLAAHPEACPDGSEVAAFKAYCARRVDGEPIAYIVGEREFYGLSLEVTPAVLIPRPETELLVDLALARLPIDSALRVLDLGTGSGAIALAIAHERPHARVVAVDASSAALVVAQKNAQRHGLANVEFIESDWYANVPNERFALIVSNPPYVAGTDPHLAEGDLRFEPRIALTPAGDGMDALRAIARGAAHFLAADGWLMVEHGFDQAHACRVLLEGLHFSDVVSHPDLAGIMRATCGRLRRPR